MRLPSRVLPTLILASAVAHAQYTIGSVAYKGGAPYMDAELTSVAGLQTGQMTKQDSLGKAAQHLLDTGLFDDVQAERSVQGKALNVVFQIKPTPIDKLLPVSLENFVWFTPEELASGLHQQLPLYRGVSSDAGSFSDSIQTALQQMLAAKGVNARLSHTIVEPTNLHPLRVVTFRAETPSVRIAKADLAGIPEALQAATLKTIAGATGRPYNEGLAGVTFADRILAPARDAGYIAAELKDLHRTVEASAQRVNVTVTASLDAGAPYKLTAISLDPGPLYAAADLARDTQLHPGDLATASLLAKTEAPMQDAYLKHGYLDAYITATPVRDDAVHTVAYTLRAVPGELYRVRTITATGLGPVAQKAFDDGWTMKAGDLYDATYIATFLKKNIAQDAFRPYTAGYQAVGDPQTHLVDCTITFTRTP